MFMIAGPNGAGKSTLYETRIKPGTSAPFINADHIQRDELRDPSMQASYKAAEVAEIRRREHLSQGKDFVSESTFSHPSKLELVKNAKEAGFRVVMYHVNLRSPELSVQRVALRFEEGGHNVPEDKIRERFARNPLLIREAVLRSDKAFIYDNSKLNKAPVLAIELTEGKVVRVSDQVPVWARTLYSKELEPFSQARLNPAAASFADAKVIACKIGGTDAVLQIPEKGKNHEGKIVGETAMHWVQQVQDRVYVAHFKGRFQGEVRLQERYKVAYGERGGAELSLLPTPKAPQNGFIDENKLSGFNSQQRAVILARIQENVAKNGRHENVRQTDNSGAEHIKSKHEPER